MSSQDRRVRIRPKDGASSLYYSGGFVGASSSTNFRQTMLGQALGDIPVLPWESNSPLSDLSANAGNFIDNISNGISTITSTVGNIANNVEAGITNFISDPSSIIPDISNFNFVGGASDTLSTLFGNSLTSSLGDSSNNILSPLAQTNGMVFPYTPTVDFNQQIDYSSYDPVHSNQELHAYQRTRAPVISITGEFTSQNQYEASYSLAAFHFCRVVSKMAFGQSRNAGTPPPILLLSAYGEYMFSDVPVILTSFSIGLPKEVDYVQVPNSRSYVPAIFSISLSLTVQHTPNELRGFSLEQFRSGQALRQGWV